MRTTLNIDDELMAKAAKITGIKEKTSLIKKGLETLILFETEKRLSLLGGTQKGLREVPRRRYGT